MNKYAQVNAAITPVDDITAKRKLIDEQRFPIAMGNLAAMAAVPTTLGLGAYAVQRLIRNRRRSPQVHVPADQMMLNKTAAVHGALLNDPKFMGAATIGGIGAVGLAALGKRLVTGSTLPNADFELEQAREEYKKALQRSLATPAATPGMKIAADASDPLELCMQICDAGFEAFEKNAVNPLAIAAVAAPLIAAASGLHGYSVGSERNLKLIKERAAEDARRRFRIARPPVVKLLTPGQGWNERDLLSLNDENNLIVPLSLNDQKSRTNKAAADRFAESDVAQDPDVASWFANEKSASDDPVDEQLYVQLTPDQIAGVFAGSLLRFGCVLPEQEKTAAEIEKLANAMPANQPLSPDEMIALLRSPNGVLVADKLLEAAKANPEISKLFTIDLSQVNPRDPSQLAAVAENLAQTMTNNDIPGTSKDDWARRIPGGETLAGWIAGKDKARLAMDPRGDITRQINEQMNGKLNFDALRGTLGEIKPTANMPQAKPEAGGDAAGGAGGVGGIMDYLKGTDPLQLLMMLGGGMGIANGNTIPGLLAMGLGLGGPALLKQLVGSGVLPEGISGGLQKYLDWHGNNSIGGMLGLGGGKAPAAPAATTDPNVGVGGSQATPVNPVGQNTPVDPQQATQTPAAVDPSPMKTQTSAVETERGPMMTTQPNPSGVKPLTPAVNAQATKADSWNPKFTFNWKGLPITKMANQIQRPGSASSVGPSAGMAQLTGQPTPASPAVKLMPPTSSLGPLPASQIPSNVSRL